MYKSDHQLTKHHTSSLSLLASTYLLPIPPSIMVAKTMIIATAVLMALCSLASGSAIPVAPAAYAVAPAVAPAAYAVAPFASSYSAHSVQHAVATPVVAPAVAPAIAAARLVAPAPVVAASAPLVAAPGYPYFL